MPERMHNIRKAVRWSVYPLTMALATFLFFELKEADGQFLVATVLPVWASLAIIAWAEWFIPYKSEWKPERQDWKLDGLYVLFIQTVLPQVLTWLAALFLFRLWKLMKTSELRESYLSFFENKDNISGRF